MKSDVLVIGELLADLVTKDFVNGLSQARDFTMFQGGSPANVCANLQWMGKKTVLVSSVGKDGIGDFITNALRALSIPDQYIHRSELPTSLVLVARSKETPDFIAYRTADTQIPEIAAELIEGTRIVHSCAFALSASPAQQHIMQAFRRASALGKMISIDWNYAPQLWKDDGQDIFHAACGSHTLLKVSMDDMQRFLGSSTSLEEIKSFLAKISNNVTCLTCGKDGVWYRDEKNPTWCHEPAQPVAEVRDVTGAGDAFWSGFLYAYLDGKPTASCVARALETAAAKIQKHGPLYA